MAAIEHPRSRDQYWNENSSGSPCDPAIICPTRVVNADFAPKCEHFATRIDCRREARRATISCSGVARLAVIQSRAYSRRISPAYPTTGCTRQRCHFFPRVERSETTEEEQNAPFETQRKETVPGHAEVQVHADRHQRL